MPAASEAMARAAGRVHQFAAHLDGLHMHRGAEGLRADMKRQARGPDANLRGRLEQPRHRVRGAPELLRQIANRVGTAK